MFEKVQKLKKEIELLMKEKIKLESELSYLEKEWDSLIVNLNIKKEITLEELEKELAQRREELERLKNEFDSTDIRK